MPDQKGSPRAASRGARRRKEGKARAILRAHAAEVRARWKALVDATRAETFRKAILHTRALAVAEALAALVVGLTLDDLQVLRVPGFLVGAATAVALLAFGGLVHGARLARRVAATPPPFQEARLARARTSGRAVLLVTALGAGLWLVYFTSGVAPWVA